MKCLLFNLSFILVFISSCQGQPAESTTDKASSAIGHISSETNKEPLMEKIIFKTKDGLEVTADKYVNENPNAKWIILCHQARYSRGEYQESALKFVEMGYACLALDQRSGDAVNNVVNETHARATQKGMGTEYADALPDVEAALDYVKNELGAKHIMLVGSSYSSSLVIIMAAKYPADIDAVVSFSPGDYFKIDGLDVSDHAKKVNLPVFITSAKNEADAWNKIYTNIPSADKTSFLPKTEGFHGSKALWSTNEGNEEYWSALTAFLKKYF